MKVVIDCGHCLEGYDKGAVGLGYREEVLTREIGKELGKILKEKGTEVIFVNPDYSQSVNESLRYRVNMANKHGNADLFMSIHLNSFGNNNANGYETLISARGGKAEKFANRIQERFISKIGLTNRGVKVNNNLFVLKNTTMPAVLVECGFITNKNDMAKYNPKEYAYALAGGILNSLDINVPQEDKKEPTEPQNPKERYFTTKNVSTSLNIREKGLDNAKIIGKIPSGGRFKYNWVDSNYLGWLYITYEGINGYVSAKYTQEVKGTKYGKVINVSSYLNVRSEPIGTSSILGKVFKDEEVKILWTEPGWHYIQYRAGEKIKEGYVSAKYIEVFLK